MGHPGLDIKVVAMQGDTAMTVRRAGKEGMATACGAISPKLPVSGEGIHSGVGDPLCLQQTVQPELPNLLHSTAPPVVRCTRGRRPTAHQNRTRAG